MTNHDREFLYFAYGSNMSSRRLKAPRRAPSATFVAVGCVAGRRLAFDKYSGRDGSGKCDCEATGVDADLVFGVIYRIAKSDRASLDTAEGLHYGYRDELIRVTAGDTVCEALAYVATDKRSGLKVFDWYLEHVLAGAMENELPPAYVDMIRQVATAKDGDVVRASRERAIYAARFSS